MGLGILESALVGAMGGWGEALAKLGEMEWKEEALKKREEYLTKSRMAEHAANKATDIRLVDDQRARDDARRGEFFKENRLPDQEIEGVEVDESGKEIGKIKGEGPADREDQARHDAKMAKLTGDKGLIEMTRGEEDTLRKNSAEERKTKAQEDANELRARELSRREEHDSKMASIAMKRLEAAERRAAEGKGTEGDTARIREAHFLARTEFGGDPKNTESPEYKEALKKAVSRVFREPDDKDYTTVTKTSYDEKGDQIKETKRVGAGRSGESSASVAKPATKSDYDKLPSGSLYINPKDGKTYRKP